VVNVQLIDVVAPFASVTLNRMMFVQGAAAQAATPVMAPLVALIDNQAGLPVMEKVNGEVPLTTVTADV